MKEIDKMKVVSDKFGSLGNWKQVKPNRLGRGKLSGISVAFTKSKQTDKHSTQNHYLRIRIAKEIADTLGWSFSTRIIPYQQKDNLYLFLLVAGEDGYKLSKESTDVDILTAKFPFEMLGPIENDQKAREVEYEILNKVSLVFNANPSLVK